MALDIITYDNKETLVDQPSIANKNKCTASDLNEIKSVVNGAVNSINGDLVVGSIRTKNMFDSYSLINGSVSASDGSYSYFNYAVVSDYLPVKANQPYIIKLNNITENQYIFRIVLYTTSKTFSSTLMTGTEKTQDTFTPTIDGYVRICFGKNNYIPLSINDIAITNVQLEEGTTPTAYTPFQNLNNESDLYLGREVKVGNYLGKPLYRQVFSLTGLSTSNTDYVDVSSLNIATLVHLYGFYKNSTGTFGIPFHDSDTNYSVIFVSSGNKIRGRFGNASAITEAKVILEYTKTTD